jgi:hypothetical protein
MTRVQVSKIEDTKAKIVAAMFNIAEPVRISDIAKETKLSNQLVNYHIKELVNLGVVIPIDSEEGCNYYALQSIFYDESLFEGLSCALLPVATALSETVYVGGDCSNPTPKIDIIRYLVNLFCDANAVEIEKQA